ncbi:hypothetical protein [Bradyrhizobium sp. HKCCYLR20261]|uniref:hypothetical protein n=1 Tax=unclassified Bradyrhizobium TaxID=2631580 RepID=UPI003EC019E6
MRTRRAGLIAGSALIAAMLFTAAAWAQSAPGAGLREAPPPQPPAATPPPPPSNPGLVEELGKLFDKMSIIPLKRPEPAEPPATDDGAQAAPSEPPQPPRQAVQPPAPKGGDNQGGVLKETGDTLSRLAKPSTMVSGRIVCPIATNGTPDCKLGADKLCQGKGYKEGKSLNTDSAETCSAKVLIPGRQRKPDDCRTDTFVTSALCQ